MAAETPITHWVFTHREILKPEMVDLSWPKDFGLDLCDVESAIFWNGRKYIGRGASENLSIAVEKACSEALERLACHYNGVSTTGAAAHSNPKLAEDNAVLEAKERYALNWYLDKKVTPLILSQLEINIPIYKLPRGTSVQRFNLINSSEGNSCISIFKTDTQYFLGLSVARTLSEAVSKSDLEALRNVSAYIGDSHTFSEAIKNSGDLLCCDNNFIENLLSGAPMQVPNSIPEINFHTKTLDLPSDAIFKNAPIHVLRAETTVEA